jgi:hypothetical protein
MYMTINKSGHDIGQRWVNRFTTSLNTLDMAVFDPKGCPVDLLIRDVY